MSPDVCDWQHEVVAPSYDICLQQRRFCSSIVVLACTCMQQPAACRCAFTFIYQTTSKSRLLLLGSYLQARALTSDKFDQLAQSVYGKIVKLKVT